VEAQPRPGGTNEVPVCAHVRHHYHHCHWESTTNGFASDKSIMWDTRTALSHLRQPLHSSALLIMRQC